LRPRDIINEEEVSMILCTTPLAKLKSKYSFVLSLGKKYKKGGINPEDTLRIQVAKGNTVTYQTSKNGKEMIVKVGF